MHPGGGQGKGYICHINNKNHYNNYLAKGVVCFRLIWDFPGGSDGKTSACNAGDLGLIPGSGRSPGEGNGNLLQYSCLENSMDGGYSPWDHKESDTTEQLCWWLLAWEMSAIV